MSGITLKQRIDTEIVKRLRTTKRPLKRVDLLKRIGRDCEADKIIETHRRQQATLAALWK